MASSAYVAAFVLLVLSWLAPNHYPPWTSFHGEMLAACSALTLLFAGTQGRRSMSLPPDALILLLATLIPLVQWFSGLIHYVGDLVLGEAYLAVLAFSVIAGRAATDHANRSQALVFLAATLVVSATLSSLVSIYQWSDFRWAGAWISAHPPGGRWFGNLGQPNHLATLLAFGVASLAYLISKGMIGRFPSCALMLIMLLSMGMTQSRLVIGFGLLVSGSTFLCRMSLGTRVFVLSAVAFATIVWCLAPALNELGGHAALASVSERLDVGVREVIWNQSILAIAASPWVGHGWLQTPVALARVVDVDVWARPVLYAHNFFLDLMIWVGFPLGLIMAALVAIRFAWLVKMSRNVDLLYGLVIFSAFLLHACLEFPFAYMYFLVPVGYVLGCVSDRGGVDCSVSVIRVLVVLSLVLTSALTMRYMGIEAAVRDARFKADDTMAMSSDVSRFDAAPFDQWSAYVNALNANPLTVSDVEQAEEIRLVSIRLPDQWSVRRAVLSNIATKRFDLACEDLARYGHLFGRIRLERFQGTFANLARHHEQVRDFISMKGTGGPACGVLGAPSKGGL